MRRFCFFFNDTATTEIYTLSLHGALSDLGVYTGEKVAEFIGEGHVGGVRFGGQELETDLVIVGVGISPNVELAAEAGVEDRKSTRLNSSHANISYAVFCLKKKPWFVLSFS